MLPSTLPTQMVSGITSNSLGDSILSFPLKYSYLASGTPCVPEFSLLQQWPLIACLDRKSGSLVWNRSQKERNMYLWPWATPFLVMSYVLEHQCNTILLLMLQNPEFLVPCLFQAGKLWIPFRLCPACFNTHVPSWGIGVPLVNPLIYIFILYFLYT